MPLILPWNRPNCTKGRTAYLLKRGWSTNLMRLFAFFDQCSLIHSMHKYLSHIKIIDAVIFPVKKAYSWSLLSHPHLLLNLAFNYQPWDDTVRRREKTYGWTVRSWNWDLCHVQQEERDEGESHSMTSRRALKLCGFWLTSVKNGTPLIGFSNSYPESCMPYRDGQ